MGHDVLATTGKRRAVNEIEGIQQSTSLDEYRFYDFGHILAGEPRSIIEIVVIVRVGLACASESVNPRPVSPLVLTNPAPHGRFASSCALHPLLVRR